MEKSERFGFNLPSSDTDDIADVNKISDNFRIIDERVPSKEELETAPKIYSGNALSVDMLGDLSYIRLEVTEGDELYNAKKGDIYINAYAFVLVNIDDAGNQIWTCLDYTERDFNPNSKNAQSGVAVAEAVENKEDKSNKVTNLFVDTDKLTHEQYPSAKATREFVNSFGSSLSGSVEEVRNMAISIANNKEDISNKVDDLKIPQSELVGKYPSALAVDDLIRTYNDGMQHDLGLKVDKEEGKELYRGMDVIFEGTIGENGIDEGISVLRIEKDMSKNAFKLDEIYFYINSATELTTSQSLSLIVNGGSGAAYYWFATTVPKGKKRLQAYGKRVKEKHWFNMQQAPCFSLYETEFSGSYVMSSVDYVTKLKIDGLTNFKAGTTILFCGRRVD